MLISRRLRHRLYPNLMFCFCYHRCKTSGNLDEDVMAKCIPWSRVCDSRADCPGKDDEGENCAKSCENVSCKGQQQSCKGRPDGQGICVCNEGYQMTNESTCIDVNECEFPIPPCSQVS